MRSTDSGGEAASGSKQKGSSLLAQGATMPPGVGPSLMNAPDIVLHTVSPTASDVYTGEPETGGRATFGTKSKIECHFSGMHLSGVRVE